MKVEVGDKIKIPGQRNRYTAQARDDRYIICNKRINLRKTVLYFIIDLKENRRCPDDQVFCSGYKTQEQCEERLKELRRGDISISLRRSIDLDVDVE